MCKDSMPGTPGWCWAPVSPRHKAHHAMSDPRVSDTACRALVTAVLGTATQAAHIWQREGSQGELGDTQLSWERALHVQTAENSTGGAAGGKGGMADTRTALLFQVFFSYISIVPWLSFNCVLDDLPTCTSVNTIS